MQADSVTIQESLDKYTWYVKDYVGRNLAVCGYVSLAGCLTDQYGNSYVAFTLTADDGSYVDPGDEEAMSRYRVVAQSVAPNTPITMELLAYSEGVEYETLVAA